MISTTLVLWLVALTFFPQTTQSCKGDCQDGYRSVCVQRGSDCKCSCIKDATAGARALRDLLSGYNVSAPTIDEAEGRYKELAGKTAGEFSFTVYDTQTGEWTIRGEGLFGTGPIDPTSSEVVSSSASEARSQSHNQQVKKGKISKNLRTKERPSSKSP